MKGRDRGSSDYEKLKNKHESDLTSKEKRQLEKEKLSRMSFKEKLVYVWAYYKVWIAALIGVVFLLIVFWQMYDNSQNNVLVSVAAANSMMADKEQLQTEFKEYLNDTNKRDIIDVFTNLSFPVETEVLEDGSLGFTLKSQMDYTSQVAFSSYLEAAAIDVMFCPESAYLVYDAREAFADIREYCSEELLSKVEITEKGTALKLDNSSVLKNDLGITYEPVYVVVMCNTERKEGVSDFLEYIFNS